MPAGTPDPFGQAPPQPAMAQGFEAKLFSKLDESNNFLSIIAAGMKEMFPDLEGLNIELDDGSLMNYAAMGNAINQITSPMLIHGGVPNAAIDKLKC